VSLQAHHLATVAAYAREARTPRDFVRLMRVRLSQSKIGPAVCRHRIRADVDLRSLGRGVRLRSHTTDIAVLGEVLEGSSYEALAGAAPRDVATIVDLGACTGLAARWLLQRFPSARLVAVEPHEGNVAVLRENLAPYPDRAMIVPACIGARERTVVMVGSREDGFSMRETDDGHGDTGVVTMEAIFEELSSDRIDVLKVDIEGAEEELFSDCASWINRIGTLSVECHHPYSVGALVQRLEASGARPVVVSSESTPFGYDMAVVRVSQ
jgi:FkbM family methyltransferase